jgi:hypothetical protein
MLRKPMYCLVAIGLVGSLALVSFVWALPYEISERSYQRINLGMSEAEVEAIIGMPEGQHGPRKRMVVTSVAYIAGTKGIPHESWPDNRRGPYQENRIRGKVKVWSDYGIWLEVAFDERGLVVGAQLVTHDWPRSKYNPS